MSLTNISLGASQQYSMKPSSHQHHISQMRHEFNNKKENNKTPHPTMQHQNMGHSMPNIPRIEKEKAYLPPPPLMGKQMGIVNTPNVPPLGYYMDGNVKVFTLIAQPMKHIFTDGKPVNEQIIPEINRHRI